MSERAKTDSAQLEEADGLEQLRAEVVSDPGHRAVYEDAKRRTSLLAAMPRVREKQKLTQRAVAEAMGTTQSSISDLESGRVDPRVRTLQRYARAVTRRLDIAFVDPDLPVYDTGMANGLWQLVEEKIQGPLLRALITRIDDRHRTLGELSRLIDFPTAIVRPVLTALVKTDWVTTSARGGEEVYTFNDDAAHVIGVSLRRHEVTGVLMNLHLDVIERKTVDLFSTSRAAVVEAALAVSDHLYRDRRDHELLGVGVTLAGVVDELGTVQFAPDLRSADDSWAGFELEATLQEQVQDRVQDPNVRVVVENDANALATRRYLLYGDRCVSTVLLSDSGGIGAGFVVDGNLLQGAAHAAGEGGHVVVQPGGAKCRAGADHYGCLETVASAHSVLERLEIPVGTFEQVQEGMAAANDRIRQRNGDAIAAFKDAGEALGQFLATTVMLFDPSDVVIYAQKQLVKAERYPSAHWYQEGMKTGFRGALSKEDHLPNPELHWREITDEMTAVAAGAMAVRHFLNRPSDWVPSVLVPRTVGGGEEGWHLPG